MSGLSYAEIGERMKCTRKAATALCHRYEHRQKVLAARQAHWASSLSVRTQNVLINLDIESADNARAMFPKLWPWKKPGYICPRNYGIMSHNELATFLGFPVVGRVARVPKTCPHCGKILTIEKE